MGCIMMRKCHLNTCPVGIATQDPVLRAKFQGTPEHVINFFFFIAEQVRRYMAQMGFRTFDEMVGRVDMLECRAALGPLEGQRPRPSRHSVQPAGPRRVARRCVQAQDHGLDQALDYKLIDHAARGASTTARRSNQAAHPQCAPHRGRHALGRNRAPLRLRRPARRHHPLPFTGSAGQSFGAFLANGVTLELEGDANDYVGKGLSGGR
jgi:glutamate synthase (NADPH) large chain